MSLVSDWSRWTNRKPRKNVRHQVSPLTEFYQELDLWPGDTVFHDETRLGHVDESGRFVPDKDLGFA